MSATFVDLKERYALGIAGRVIPAAAWLPLSRAQELVDQANGAVRALEGELEAERAAAREQGLAEGRREALDHFAAATSALGIARDQLAERMRNQVTELAVAIVERIAPALGADKLVPMLVGEAIRQLAFEPNLIVRVHPDVADATRQRLASDGFGLGGTPATEIVATPEFSEFDCVIETEGGVVRAGLREQLDQVRTILAVAREQAADTPWTRSVAAADGDPGDAMV
ncbi:FliH/SctL family protein [Dokdonella sp.]|uniref:FliH/SctL family protein n=1 Tax=Dokdonella sp. TaxID=2291710 RepID=UPI0026294DCE|nr:FliH/SctL family protein [Dokdonella sp.]